MTLSVCTFGLVGPEPEPEQQEGFFTTQAARFAWNTSVLSRPAVHCVPRCPQARAVPGSPAGLRSLAGPVLQRGAPAEPRAVHLPGVHSAGGHHPPHQLQGTAGPGLPWGLGAALCIPEQLSTALRVRLIQE